MRGQVWAEYLLIAGAMVVLSVAAFVLTEEPVEGASACSAAHVAALKEIIREEVRSLTNTTLRGLSCDITGGEVNVHCDCTDANRVRQEVADTLDKFGVKNVRVRVVK